MTAKLFLRRCLPSVLLMALCLAPAAHSQELVDTLTSDPGDTSVGTVHAVSGDRAVIAVDGPGGRRLRFYDKTPSGWVFDQELIPGFDGFYFELDMDGDVLVVGATDYPVSEVLIYERQASGAWSLTTSFAHPQSIVKKIAVQGNTVAVGYEVTALGIVRVYRDSGSGWAQISEFNGGSDIFEFGAFLDLEGPWLAVGRPDQEQGGGGGGYAGWIRLYIDQGTEYSFFGNIHGGPTMGFRQLDLDGDRLLTVDGNPKIFHYDGTGWSLEDDLFVPVNPNFKLDVALRGKVAVVSVPDEGAGALYTFAREGTRWYPTGRLLDDSGLSADDFGQELDVSGATLLAAGAGDGNMGAQVFDLPINTRPYGVCPTNFSPCGNWAPYSGCLNSTGQGATLSVQGTVSVTEDDLVFTMRSLPPNSFGLLFMGGDQDSVVLGDGLRVVAAGTSGLFRFLPEQADNAGVLVQGPGLAAVAAQLGGPIIAGSSWNFQGWYRDSQGGPCGSGFNLTNGIQANFLP